MLLAGDSDPARARDRATRLQALALLDAGRGELGSPAFTRSLARTRRQPRAPGRAGQGRPRAADGRADPGQRRPATIMSLRRPMPAGAGPRISAAPCSSWTRRYGSTRGITGRRCSAASATSSSASACLPRPTSVSASGSGPSRRGATSIAAACSNRMAARPRRSSTTLPRSSTIRSLPPPRSTVAGPV